MNGDMHRVEVQIDDHCFTALEGQAQKLGVDLQDVVRRAMSAWLNDMCEGETDGSNGTVQQV